MKKMKHLIIGTVIVGVLVAIFAIKPQENQYKGFSQLVARVLNTDDSKRAHNLDLSKYRPKFQSE